MATMSRTRSPLVTKATLFLFLLSLLSLVGWKTDAYAQSSSGLTSDGRDFFLGHMPSSNRCTNTTKYMGVWALVTSQFNATVTVSYFDDAGVEQPGTTYSIPKNSSKRIKLTTQAMELNDKKGEGDGEFKACHIKANAPIAVQYYTTGPNSCGMYSAAPTNALGKEYVVQTWYSNPGNGIGVSGYACPRDSSASEFMVIAPFDNTQVEIHNTGLTMKGRTGICYGKNAAGGDKSFTVTLKRGQCYMVKSTYYDDQNSMDGTYIKASKPVAVLSAQENAINGTPSINNILYEDVRDLMVEQMIPVEYWSDKDYFSMPLRDSGPRNNDDNSLGELYRVYAMGDDNLTFNIDKQGPRDMQVGQFCKYAQQSNVETGVNIRSQNGTKIGVAMFDYRQQNQNQPFPAPSQMTIIPASSWKKFYSWMVPDDQIIAVRNFFVNIITNKDSLTGGKVLISVNGGPGRSANSFPAAGGYELIPGHPELIGKRIVVGPGSYSLYGNTPCAVYHYGMEAFDLDGDLGDNEGDDFYFGYASPVGQSYSKPGGKPRVEAIPDCSGWDVRVVDSADGLASIELLNDPDGLLLGKPYVSNNVQLQPLDYELIPGSLDEKIRIQVRNPLADAIAYLYIVNRAGNDTLVTYKYVAPKLKLAKEEGGKTRQDSIGFKPIVVNSQICSYFTLKNTSASGGQDFLIKSVKQILNDKDIKITKTTPNIGGGLNLKPGDSLKIEVCYSASDTGLVHFDSIIVKTECFDAPLYVEGRGVTPLIKATDYTFPETLVGDTICKTVRVQNVGSYDLTIDKNFLLKDQQNFSIDGTPLPKVLKPGQSIDLSVCYHPTHEGPDSTTSTWANDIPTKYQGSIKDFSILKGVGTKPGLLWDRALQFDTTTCDSVKIIRVNLLNKSTAAKTHVDKVVIEGPDSLEYTIANNQTGYDPLVNFDMQKNEELWVDIRFLADLSKPLPARYQNRKMKLVAYGQNDIIKTIDFETTVLYADAASDRANIDFGAVQLDQDGSQYVTITNNGTANYLVGNLAMLNGKYFFVDSGLKVGDVITAGSSVTVKLRTYSKQDDGIHLDTLMVDDYTSCAAPLAIPLNVVNPFIKWLSTGAPFDSIFKGGPSEYPGLPYCDMQTDSSVMFQNLGYTKIRLRSVKIVDDPDIAIPLTFEFGFDFNPDHTPVQTLDIEDTLLSRGEFKVFPVKYHPTTSAYARALVIFELDTNAGIFFDTVVIEGSARVAKAIFLASRTDFITDNYTGKVDEVITVPVRMKRALPVTEDVNGTTVPGAKAYGYTFTFTYRRDLFKFEGADPAPGYTWTTAPQVNSNAPGFETITLTAMGDKEIDSVLWANIRLRVMLTTDTTSKFEIEQQAVLGKDGTTLCYVDAESVPGNFVIENSCGDNTIRDFMGTGNAPVSIIDVNPGQTDSKVRFNVNQDGAVVTVDVYDMLGKKVTTLVNGVAQNAGEHSVQFDTKSLNNGSYVVRVSTPTWSDSKAITVSK